MARILVAMSGGVDSAVAALLLSRAGHSVHGVYMKNWINEENILGNCPWQQDIQDAEAAADAIGIEFEVVNFMQAYRDRIVTYLIDGYRSGLTPNPDVMCNREMKFGVLGDWALEHGFEAVATGHYAIRKETSGHARVYEGIDKNKDQSYFLAMVRTAQIARALFPIGELAKSRVRALAREAALPNADKRDSQGICFIGEIRINDFLEKFISDDPGPIVNLEGRVVGEHRGLHRYTIGQRKGIGVPSNTDGEFYVVVGKDLPHNALLVAFESPDAHGLYQRRMRLHSLNWIGDPIMERCTLLAKPRYRDPSATIAFSPDLEQGPGCATIEFSEPQRALAAGQVCAIYDGECLLGGGIYA